MAELRFNQKSPIITVFAKIEGEKTRRVKGALDTGATYVMISWKIAEILVIVLFLLRRQIITAGGMKVHNLEALIHDLPKESYVEGLLGLSFLRNFKVCLDFRKGVLKIER